jgi:hypothetical protein
LYANDKDASIRPDIIELPETTGSYKLAMQTMSQVMIMLKDSFNRNRANDKKIPDEIWAKVKVDSPSGSISISTLIDGISRVKEALKSLGQVES